MSEEEWDLVALKLRLLSPKDFNNLAIYVGRKCEPPDSWAPWALEFYDMVGVPLTWQTANQLFDACARVAEEHKNGSRTGL